MVWCVGSSNPEGKVDKMCLNGMPLTDPKLIDFLSLTMGDTIRNNLDCKGMYKKKNDLTH